MCTVFAPYTWSTADWQRLLNGYKDEVEYEWNRDAKAEQHEDLTELIHRERGCG
jgi:hypothetical protein